MAYIAHIWISVDYVHGSCDWESINGTAGYIKPPQLRVEAVFACASRKLLKSKEAERSL